MAADTATPDLSLEPLVRTWLIAVSPSTASPVEGIEVISLGQVFSDSSGDHAFTNRSAVFPRLSLGASLNVAPGFFGLEGDSDAVSSDHFSFEGAVPGLIKIGRFVPEPVIQPLPIAPPPDPLPPDPGPLGPTSLVPAPVGPIAVPTDPPPLPTQPLPAGPERTGPAATTKPSPPPAASERSAEIFESALQSEPVENLGLVSIAAILRQVDSAPDTMTVQKRVQTAPTAEASVLATPTTEGWLRDAGPRSPELRATEPVAGDPERLWALDFAFAESGDERPTRTSAPAPSDRPAPTPVVAPGLEQRRADPAVTSRIREGGVAEASLAEAPPRADHRAATTPGSQHAIRPTDPGAVIAVGAALLARAWSGDRGRREKPAGIDAARRLG